MPDRRSLALDTDHRRRHRLATSRAMKALAEAKRCPACGRKGALQRHEELGFVLRTCRWCGHEDSWNPDAGRRTP